MPIRGRGIDLDTYSIASAAITTEASLTATTSATGNTCITTGAFTVENAGQYLVEVFTPYITKGTTNVDLELWDGAAMISTLTGHLAASVVSQTTFVVRVTLASGSHNLTVKGFVDAGTGKFGANNGATGNAPNALLLVSPA